MKTLSKAKRIKFNKEFAKGNQYTYINADGKVQDLVANYYWEERPVYNHTESLVEWAKQKMKDVQFLPDEEEQAFYGESGLVERLIPYQRLYNSLKGRYQEYVNRLSLGIAVVEDGSVDVSDLDSEGINPGKVLIYRQGSVPPSIQYPDADILPTISKECERVWSDMSDIADSFVNYYTNR